MAATTYILMAGLPGAGKTTLAQALVPKLHAVILSKDTLRAALFPGPLTEYTREQDDLCFTMVLQAAHYLATHNRVPFIFLDGRTFSRREQLDEAVKAAEGAGCGWRILYATCPDQVAEARLIEDPHHPAANRTVEMYREAKARFEPISYPHLALDTSGALEGPIEQALSYLRSGE